MAQALFAALIVAVSTGIASSNALNEPTLKITAGHQKHLEVGKDIQFECESSQEKVNISWLHPNGTRVKMGDERRIYQASKTLQIREASVNDSGIYTCYSEHSRQNSTIALVVYVLPTFHLESMIIVGINSFLVALFFICFLYTFVYQKWKSKKEGKGSSYQSEKKRVGTKC